MKKQPVLQDRIDSGNTVNGYNDESISIDENKKDIGDGDIENNEIREDTYVEKIPATKTKSIRTLVNERIESKRKRTLGFLATETDGPTKNEGTIVTFEKLTYTTVPTLEQGLYFNKLSSSKTKYYQETFGAKDMSDFDIDCGVYQSRFNEEADILLKKKGKLQVERDILEKNAEKNLEELTKLDDKFEEFKMAKDKMNHEEKERFVVFKKTLNKKKAKFMNDLDKLDHFNLEILKLSVLINGIRNRINTI
jgi:hypothetical protein